MNKKHGMYRTPTYNSWAMMLQRCSDDSGNSYKSMRYGGRGVKVCERWKVFKNFIEDMGIRPESSTIDRIDSDKGYCKENCRWADKKTQAINRKSTKVFSHLGKTLCLSDWAKFLNITPAAMTYRIKNNWNKARIFETLNLNKNHA